MPAHACKLVLEKSSAYAFLRVCVRVNSSVCAFKLYSASGGGKGQHMCGLIYVSVYVRTRLKSMMLLLWGKVAPRRMYVRVCVCVCACMCTFKC